jgi:hypothetical protein
MSDAVPEELFRQLQSIGHRTEEDFAVMASKSAEAFASGTAPSLTAAVVDTVKQAHLNPEQVRRVVELTNTNAFLCAFTKAGSAGGQGSRYVVFDNGPADPTIVLQQLQDRAVRSNTKTAAAHDFDAYAVPPRPADPVREDVDQYMGDRVKSAEAIEYATPLTEVYEAREKIADTMGILVGDLGLLQNQRRDVEAELYGLVKQACLAGHTIGDVLRTIQPVATELLHVKLAFAAINPLLLRYGIFPDEVELQGSIVKTASVGASVPNPNHPLPVTFVRYGDLIDKIAGVVDQIEEATQALGFMDRFIKQAQTGTVDGALAGAIKVASEASKEAASSGPKGLWHHATDAATWAGDHVGAGARAVGDQLFGEGSATGKYLGQGAKGAVKYSPHVLAALGAANLYQGINTATQHPAAQTALSFVPGTEANYNARMQNIAAMQGQGGGYYM